MLKKKGRGSFSRVFFLSCFVYLQICFFLQDSIQENSELKSHKVINYVHLLGILLLLHHNIPKQVKCLQSHKTMTMNIFITI